MESNIIVQENKNNIAEFSIIQSKIHVIRGYKVMLDFDLATMYEVENKYLKRSVRSNIERFEGEDFMFELTKKEWESLRCNFCTSNEGSKRGGIRYMPFAFTQLGIAMLSSVLNSEKAIKTNRKIMRAFAAIQQYAVTYAELKHELDMYVSKTDKKIDDIFEILEELIIEKEKPQEPRNPIGFKQKNQ